MMVYRVELNGTGPYRGKYTRKNKFFKKMFLHHNNDDNHPGLWKDFRKALNSKEDRRFVFGFKSIEQLKEWFYGYRTGLRKYGFKVCVYKTKNYKYGKSKKQLIFKKNRGPIKIMDIP